MHDEANLLLLLLSSCGGQESGCLGWRIVCVGPISGRS
jgi:hypothetical protein